MDRMEGNLSNTGSDEVNPNPALADTDRTVAGAPRPAATGFQSFRGNMEGSNNNYYNNGLQNPSLLSLDQRQNRLANDIVMRDEERGLQISVLTEMMRNLADRIETAETNTTRVMNAQEDTNHRLAMLAADNDLHRRTIELLRRRTMLDSTGNQPPRTDVYGNLDDINLRSTGSAFRRPERNGSDHFPTLPQCNHGISWPSFANVPPPPVIGQYPNQVNSICYFDNHLSSNLSTAGIGLNSGGGNRDGFAFNPSAHFGYHAHNSSASAFNTGNGQPVLNNLTLNNQIQPPRQRANNYWDNFRSYSRQNLLSSPKLNGSIPSAPNVETRQAAGYSLPPEELNNQSGTSQVQNNFRPDLMVNRNPVGNGSKAHLRSPEFVENIASSKKKNKDQSHVHRLNSGATTSSAVVQTDIQTIEGRTDLPCVQQPEVSAGAIFPSLGSNPRGFKMTSSEATIESKTLTEQMSKFIHENEHRPAYVHELLQKLSALGTDEARRRAISAIEEVANVQHSLRNLDLEDSSRQSPFAGGERSAPLPLQQSSMSAQPHQQAVVTPFNFRTDDGDEENLENVELPSEQLIQLPPTIPQPSRSSIDSTPTDTHSTRRIVLGPSLRDADREEELARQRHAYFQKIVGAAASQDSDSDDGEIHDLMDLAVAAQEGQTQLANDGQNGEDEARVEGGVDPARDREHEEHSETIDGEDNSGFTPIRF